MLLQWTLLQSSVPSSYWRNAFRARKGWEKQKLLCSGIYTFRWCLICKMQIEQKLFCRYGLIYKIELLLSKGHIDDIQTSLEHMKNSTYWSDSTDLILTNYIRQIQTQMIPEFLTHFTLLPGFTCNENTWCLLFCPLWEAVGDCHND